MLVLLSPPKATVVQSGAPEVGREAPPELLPRQQGQLLQVVLPRLAVHLDRLPQLVPYVHVRGACTSPHNVT